MPAPPPAPPPAPVFRLHPADEPPARELIAAMVSEVSALYGERLDAPGGPTARPDELRPPAGVCLVGWRAGEPVAVGVVKRLADGLCEIKRMYVRPAARGGGVGRALLEALEAAARDLGYRRVRLDTGPRQPRAEALYRAAGYAPVADYNGNPFASFWAEKRL